MPVIREGGAFYLNRKWGPISYTAMPTILYAEDDENDVFFMKRAFAKIGGAQQLVVVPDGQKALDYVLGREEFTDRAAHPRPAFVLLDLKMPNLTGIEALQEIRINAETDDLPVVFLTSSIHDKDIAAAHALRANGYFAKPAKVAELVELLGRLLASYAEAVQKPGLLAIAGNRLVAWK